MMAEQPVKQATAHLSHWFHSYRPDDHHDPYPFYDQLLCDYPFVFLEERNMWIASRYNDVAQILKHPAFVREYRNTLPPEERDQLPPSSPVWKPINDMTGNWMLFRDAPSHTRLRGLVNHAFTPRMMEKLRPSIEQLARPLAADMNKCETPDLLTDYAFPLPVLVIADLLGVPHEDQELFKEWSNSIARLLDIAILPEETVKHISGVVTAMKSYFQELVAARRMKPREDLISSLLEAHDQGDRLTEDELIATCVLLLVAGHETTVNLIGNGVSLLLRHPDQLELLRSRPDLISSAVEEMLRYESPVQMTGRLVGSPIEIRGRLLKQGQAVNVMLGAANRDPEQFPEPGKFIINRTPNRHLAFASGPHFCLGAPLARMEAEIAISTLLQTYPHLSAVESPLSWRSNILFRGLKSLKIKL